MPLEEVFSVAKNLDKWRAERVPFITCYMRVNGMKRGESAVRLDC